MDLGTCFAQTVLSRESNLCPGPGPDLTGQVGKKKQWAPTSLWPTCCWLGPALS